MLNKTQDLLPSMVFSLGYNLEKLEWALATLRDPVQLSRFYEPFRACFRIPLLQDIGEQAALHHDWLANYQNISISLPHINGLRESRSEWQSLIAERLSHLFLMNPKSDLDPKKLLEGPEEFLTPEIFSSLSSIEVSALSEAAKCLVSGSSTASEQMSLRAAENFLRRWYEVESGELAGRKKWRALLIWFNNEYPGRKEAEEAISLLDYLNIRRNNLADADFISDAKGAERTFLNVCGLIRPIGVVSESKLELESPIEDLIAFQEEENQEEPQISSEALFTGEN